MKTLVLQIDGKTYSTVREADVTVGAITTSLGKDGLTVTMSEAPFSMRTGAGLGLMIALLFHEPAAFVIGVVLGFGFWLFSFFRRTSYTLPFQGAELKTIDRKTNVRGAGVGLVVGEALFGPLGAIAGAAAGLSTTTTVMLTSGNKVVVFQPNDNERRALAARGLLVDG
jgi:hypothetical protein